MHLIKNIQIIALSATIGNPKQLADWMKAELIEDNWRPTQLKHGTYFNGEIEFMKKSDSDKEQSYLYSRNGDKIEHP